MFALLAASCAAPRPGAPPSTGPAVPPSSAPPPVDSTLGVWWPALGAPRLDASGRVDWTPRAEWSLDLARLRGAALRGDTVAVWRAFAADTTDALRSFALERLAFASLGRGDSLAADSLLATLAALRSPWAWEALATRADLARARGDLRGADALLEQADRGEWSDRDRAAWLTRRAALAVERGDTAVGIDFARQTVQRYVSLPASARAVALLDSVAAARREPMSLADMEAAAESERQRGARDAAARRLLAARGRAPVEDRTRLDLRAAQILREARRFEDGLAAADRAIRETTDDDLRARARLERARLLRDAGRQTEALKLYLKVASAGPREVRAAAAWELALEQESARRFDRARQAHAQVVDLAGGRRDDASLRLGLLWVASGMPQRALAPWSGLAGDAPTFWRGVLARRGRASAADSLLQGLARAPGYGYYAVAARETLGVRGWSPEAVASDTGAAGDTPALELAERLVALSYADDAMLVLQRWSALVAEADAADRPDTGRAGEAPASLPPLATAHLRAARLAYAAGKTPAAIRLAQRAFDLSVRAEPEARWGVVPWLYPPAFDSLYTALGDAAGPIDGSLLRAVAWQESRFDSAARSRSNALGLYQLKLATAGDMARRLHEPAPAERDLMTPATSLRLGREYLHWLLERFDGEWIVALSAYNAGPGSVPDGWRPLLDRGGAALYGELIARGETLDYLRRILGARQAYRDLRPFAAPR